MEKSYKPIYEKNYNFGIKEEEKLKPELESFFKVDLQKTNGRYNLFDFIGKECYIEIKSRNNRLNQYPTTIVGMNKIIKAKQLNKEGNRIFFIFNFIDSIDFWEYKENNYNKRNINRRDRPGYKGSEYLEIPIKDLLNIAKK